MAYVIPWGDLTVPGSTTPAADIDVKLTNIPSALKERLEDKLVVDAAADPWVLKDTAGGPVVGKSILIPPEAFRLNTGAGSEELDTLSIGAFGNSDPLQAPLILPPGVTLTLVEFMVGDNNVGINWEIYRHQLVAAVPVKLVVASGNKPGVNGVQIFDSGVLAHVISGAHFYHLSLDTDVSNALKFITVYGARISYNTPSGKETY